MRTISIPSITLLMAACAADAEPVASVPPTQAAMCNADPVQSYVGQKVSAELGTRILGESGGTILRWGPPRTAFTRDYRRERVNVMYGDNMIITDINCG